MNGNQVCNRLNPGKTGRSCDGADFLAQKSPEPWSERVLSMHRLAGLGIAMSRASIIGIIRSVETHFRTSLAIVMNKKW